MQGSSPKSNLYTIGLLLKKEINNKSSSGNNKNYITTYKKVMPIGNRVLEKLTRLLPLISSERHKNITELSIYDLSPLTSSTSTDCSCNLINW